MTEPSSSPGKLERGTVRWWLSWLPVILLVAGVVNHLWQVHRHELSPWLGAGFGMFSTTDVDSNRQVYLSVLLEDGSKVQLALGEQFRDAWQRARALPTNAWLSRLAEATFRALAQTPELEFPDPPRRLCIEVWRISFQERTLTPLASLLARRSFPFPGYAD